MVADIYKNKIFYGKKLWNLINYKIIKYFVGKKLWNLINYKIIKYFMGRNYGI